MVKIICEEKNMHVFSVKKKWILIMSTVLLLLSAAGCGVQKKQPEEVREEVQVRIGALKGPTTMGLLFMMQEEEQKTESRYTFQMAVGADELMPLMVKGELDIALLPSNAAAILYQKTEGKVSVIDINTMSVLWLISQDEEMHSMEDLAGRTVYLPGKGTGPDCVLQYLLTEEGFGHGEVKLEYCSEASEVVAMLAQKEKAAGFLPQPFVTAALMQNEAFRLVCSAQDEWMKVSENESGSEGPVTGVTVVRTEFLNEHPELVTEFLESHRDSAGKINSDPETGAVYCVEARILPKEPIARKAIPACSISCITGEKMKASLEAYLKVLYEYAPDSVGGALPGDDFYYCPEQDR